MDNILNSHEELISIVKTIILNYCPYVEDRLSIISNSLSSELDINISINNNVSQIMFVFGNRRIKSSVPERATISYIISFEEISKIIDFLLIDHETIKNLNIMNNKIELKFCINWSDKSIKGINCGDIGLNLDFDNMELKNQYLYLLFQRYFAYLENTSSFKLMKSKYIETIKHNYFNTLDKNQLISLLNKMSENELKELLYNLDNDDFIKYIMNQGKQPKVKKLSLEDNN